MSQNDGFRMNHHSVLRVASFFTAFFMLSFAGCENALVVAVKSIQAETVSPRISLDISDGTSIGHGGEYDFGIIPKGDSGIIEILLKNEGKQSIIIDINSIKVTKSISTPENTFICTSLPTAMVEPGTSSSIIFSFNPTETTGRSATVIITTNDIL